MFVACVTGGCPAADSNGYFAFASGNPFTFSFATAQSSVSFQSVIYNTANGFASSLFAQAYDTGGTAIGTGVTVNDYGVDNTVYTLSGAGIARVDFAYGRGTNGPAITNLTFSVPTATGAVPEPATWAMMLVGFGAAGFTMRRRTVKTAAKHAA